MPFIASIVNYINASLKANCALLTDGTFHGLATVVARKKDKPSKLEQFPGVLVNHTQYETIEPNDKYKLIVYHKLLQNTYSWERKSHGDGYQQKCTTDLQMIVWGDSKKLGIDEELEAAVLFAMPQRLSRAAMLDLGLIGCLVTPLSSTLDRLTVFRQEYPQSEFFLKPNHQFFSIKYRVETTYDQRCVDLCMARATLTFASAQSFEVGMQLVERFQVGANGAPMAAGDTVYTHPALAGRNLFVTASNIGLPVDDGTVALDWPNLGVRYVQKPKSSTDATFVGGVIDKEWIEIYITN